MYALVERQVAGDKEVEGNGKTLGGNLREVWGRRLVRDLFARESPLSENRNGCMGNGGNGCMKGKNTAQDGIGKAPGASASALSALKVAVIGAGNLGGTVSRRLSGKVEGLVVSGRGEKLARLEEWAQKEVSAGRLEGQAFQIEEDAPLAVRQADVAFLCVKPKDMGALLEKIGRECKGKLVISTAAGVSVGYLEGRLNGSQVVRCMPNLCAEIGLSQTAVSSGKGNGQAALARELLSVLGKTYELEEGRIAAWTSICASGPAFLAAASQGGMREEEMALCMRESLCLEGFEEGEAGKIAREILASTTLLLRDRYESIEEFVRAVASKRGTTEAGLKAAGAWDEEKGFISLEWDGGMFRKALLAAKGRAQEIERENSSS